MNAEHPAVSLVIFTGMKNIESFETPMHSREARLLKHQEKPANVWEHQVLLAAELYERDKGKVKIFDHATKEAVMEYWGNHGYSAVFGEIAARPDFAERFNSDARNITLADVDYYIRKRELSPS